MHSLEMDQLLNKKPSKGKEYRPHLEKGKIKHTRSLEEEKS